MPETLIPVDATPTILDLPVPRETDSTALPKAPPPNPPVFTINDLVEAGRQAGVHPSIIRRKLQSLGIHWGYSYPRHQGLKERERRMRQLARRLA